MRFVIGILVISLMSSCITERKRQDIFHRYAREHPAEALELCPEPTVKLAPGATIELPPKTIHVPVPVIKLADGSEVKPDSVPCICPPSYTRVDTAYRVDEAEVKRLGLLLAAEKSRGDKLEGELTAVRSSSRGKNWWIAGLCVLAAAVAFVRVKFFRI